MFIAKCHFVQIYFDFVRWGWWRNSRWNRRRLEDIWRKKDQDTIREILMIWDSTQNLSLENEYGNQFCVFVHPNCRMNWLFSKMRINSNKIDCSFFKNFLFVLTATKTFQHLNRVNQQKNNKIRIQLIRIVLQ